MAKGANDIILRDRLQFDITAQGGTALAVLICQITFLFQKQKVWQSKRFDFNSEHAISETMAFGLTLWGLN